MIPLALDVQRHHTQDMAKDAAEIEFAEDAARAWREKRDAYLDPEGAFEETHGRYPAASLEKHFKAAGAPFRDYSKDGLDWLRKIGAR